MGGDTYRHDCLLERDRCLVETWGQVATISSGGAGNRRTSARAQGTYSEGLKDEGTPETRARSGWERSGEASGDGWGGEMGWRQQCVRCPVYGAGEADGGAGLGRWLVGVRQPRHVMGLVPPGIPAPGLRAKVPRGTGAPRSSLASVSQPLFQTYRPLTLLSYQR